MYIVPFDTGSLPFSWTMHLKLPSMFLHWQILRRSLGLKLKLCYWHKRPTNKLFLSHTLNLFYYPLCSTVFMLNPKVGEMVLMSSPMNFFKMVVLPALSKPLRESSKTLNHELLIVKHWDTWTRNSIFKVENAYGLTLGYVCYANSSNNGSSFRLWVIHKIRL